MIPALMGCSMAKITKRSVDAAVPGEQEFIRAAADKVAEAIATALTRGLA